MRLSSQLRVGVLASDGGRGVIQATLVEPGAKGGKWFHFLHRRAGMNWSRWLNGHGKVSCEDMTVPRKKRYKFLAELVYNGVGQSLR